MRQGIKGIAGTEVREAAVEVEPTTGIVVQVFLLTASLSAGRVAAMDQASSAENGRVLRFGFQALLGG